MTRTRIAAIVLISAIALLAAGLAGAGTSGKSSASSTKANLAVSGSVTFDGIWTAGEAAAFGKVIKAFNKVYPNVNVNYKPVGNNLPTVLATAIAGGHPPDMADIAQPGYVKQLAQQGHLKPITYAKAAMAAELRAGLDQPRHVQRQAVRARLQGVEQVALLVQRARVQDRRREAAEDVGAAHSPPQRR